MDTWVASAIEMILVTMGLAVSRACAARPMCLIQELPWMYSRSMQSERRNHFAGTVFVMVLKIDVLVPPIVGSLYVGTAYVAVLWERPHRPALQTAT